MTVARIFTVVFWVWVASEWVLQVLTRTWKRGETRDRGSLVVLLAGIFLSIMLGLSYASTHGATMGERWLQWAGLLIFLAGVALRATAIAQLGRAFSVNVAIRADQKLYRRGLYRWMRHPSYTGLLVIYTGLGVETRNWVALAIILVPSTAVLMYRINVEERALREGFGAEYVRYCAEVKRLVPWVY